MYKKILVPLDGSKLAECVFPHVESIAQGCGLPTVVLFRAADFPYFPSGGEYVPTAEQLEQMQQQSHKQAQDYLSDAMRRLKYSGEKRIETAQGPAAAMIADYAAKSNCDLIVIATHGRSGVSRWIWGSVADRVLRSSCVPVLMIRAPGCVAGV